MRVLLPTVVLLAAPVVGFSGTIYVPDHHATIQAAIDAAADGDEVIVRPGTYVENIDFLGKAITVASQRGPELTIIDGGSPINPLRASVVTFMNGEGPDSVLDGFTLRNGTGNTVGGPVYNILGGGVYCHSASPMITNNVITANSAYQGGGIWSKYLGPTIRGNTIHGNFGDHGAGIGCEYSSAVISDNLIYGNSTTGPFAFGGGVCSYVSDHVISNNIIWDNFANLGGGGVYGGWGSNWVLVNNVLAANSTQGKGGGMLVSGTSVAVFNSVIWENTGPDGAEIYAEDIPLGPAVVALGHSDVRGGQSLIMLEPGCSLVWGAGMINADPLFADPAALDFHLRWDSPCRNAGDNAAVLDAFDFEGDDRITDATVDMGADEFHARLYLVGTPAPGASVTVKVVGTPGSPKVFLAQGIALLDPPLSLPYGDLYIVWPFPWFSNLGGIPASGIRARSESIPSDWSTSGFYPFQALVVSPTLSWELTNPLLVW